MKSFPEKPLSSPGRLPSDMDGDCQRQTCRECGKSGFEDNMTMSVHCYGGGPRFEYTCDICQPVKRCEECDKIMGDEEQCQPICELCSAGIHDTHKGDPCEQCGTPHDEVSPGPCRGQQ